jgi:hypothetical protein
MEKWMTLQELILEYKPLLVNQKVYDEVRRLGAILLQYGNCPSVITKRWKQVKPDSETVDLYDFPDALTCLSNVSLLDHSVSVAEAVLELSRSSNPDHETAAPKLLVTALAHDIGKAFVNDPKSACYRLDHAEGSAGLLGSIFKDRRDVPWLNAALDAVRNHHARTIYVKDVDTLLLKKAEGICRECELCQSSAVLPAPYSKQKWGDWFSPSALIELIKPEVNIVSTLKDNGKSVCDAFSFKGVVYCQPYMVYRKARELAALNHVAEYSLMSHQNKDSALLAIIPLLRDSGMTYNIGSGFYGRWYEVDAPGILRAKLFLTSLKMEFFGPALDLHKKKAVYGDLLLKIESIVPCRKN